MPLQIETAEPLRREIRMLRECNHENIVAYRDAFMREYAMRSMLWVIMEFCDGGSALDLMRKLNAPLTEAAVSYVCARLLAALEYLPAATLLTSTVWLENRTRRGVPILHDEPPKHDEPSFASTLLARSSPSQFPPLSHVTPFIGNLPITPAVPSCPASFNPNEYTAPLSVDTTV